MSFIQDLQQKPIRTRKKILWGGVIIIAIILFSFLIWQQKKQLSYLKTSSGNIPQFKLPKEEIERLKGYIGKLKELEKQPQIPGIQKEDVDRIKSFKEEDFEKLSEDDKKTLTELIKKLQEKKSLSEDDIKTLGELIKKIQANIDNRTPPTK